MMKQIIVVGPIIVENNKVLLCQHGDDNFWKFCGGRMENFDSDYIATARREVKEEMGFDIEIINQEPFILHTNKSSVDDVSDVVLIHYLAKKIGDIKPGIDIRGWQWFDLNNLPNNLAPNIIPTLKYFTFIK